MVNIAIEKPMTLQQIASLLPVSYTTIFRWHKYGIRGVRLETIPLGVKRVTSLEAVQRFSERLAKLEDCPTAPKVAGREDAIGREMKERFGL